MDFDDQLIAQLNAPEHRTPTPPPPPQDATTTSTPPTNPTTTPSLHRPTMTAKDGESYYIKPIPSGLRAPSLSSLMQLCHTHTPAPRLRRGLELELSEGLFDSQFPRQPISQQAIPQFVQPQYIPRFSQPPYGRAARSVDVAEDVAMTPTVDVSFAELQLVTPQPSRVSNSELATSHLRDDDADRLFLDSRYIAPQAHAKLTLPSSVALRIAINNDDAEDIALTPDMGVSFEDLRAVTPQHTVPSTNKPASLKLVTKSIEVTETRDVLMTNKLPRVINQMPRFTTVALNHATPSFYCPACGYMLNSKPTMHIHIWQNHENAVDVLTQFQFDTNAHIKKLTDVMDALSNLSFTLNA
ncbi:unnamed protein product [Aureobasidium pullulans]|nr:unnamed protein product [Aureobasidium pullulans]